MIRPLVLVVDDEPAIQRLLRLELSSGGFGVIATGSGEEALRLLAEHRPDAVLLDLILPDMPGLEVLKGIKAAGDTPVMLVTARSSEGSQVEAFELGADDFISKPFSPQRVSDGLRFLFGRSSGESAVGTPIVAGDLEIDMRMETVRRAGAPVHLANSEWRLLKELAQSPGEPKLNSELLSRVWGSDYRDDVRYLRLWITRLRNRLGDDDSAPRIVVPYLDVGYVLSAGKEADGD